MKKNLIKQQAQRGSRLNKSVQVGHLIYIVMGLILASAFRVVPIDFLERISRPLMWLSALVLLLVFIPGIGRSVNGSSRWITLGALDNARFREFPGG